MENLHFVKRLGLESKAALEAGNVKLFGEHMHEHWLRKRVRSVGMSNPEIDEWYSLAMENGAIGGKLVGAGGGGFLMFMAEDKSRLRRAMQAVGLEELRFNFEFRELSWCFDDNAFNSSSRRWFGDAAWRCRSGKAKMPCRH